MIKSHQFSATSTGCVLLTSLKIGLLRLAMSTVKLRPPLPYSARHRVNFVQLLSIPFGIESLLTIAFKNAKKVASGPL